MMSVFSVFFFKTSPDANIRFWKENFFVQIRGSVHAFFMQQCSYYLEELLYIESPFNIFVIHKIRYSRIFVDVKPKFTYLLLYPFPELSNVTNVTISRKSRKKQWLKMNYYNSKIADIRNPNPPHLPTFPFRMSFMMPLARHFLILEIILLPTRARKIYFLFFLQEKRCG